jgi:hypothetical protein
MSGHGDFVQHHRPQSLSVMLHADLGKRMVAFPRPDHPPQCLIHHTAAAFTVSGG